MISKILVTYNYSYNAASDWLCTFLQPGCFCLAYPLAWGLFEFLETQLLEVMKQKNSSAYVGTKETLYSVLAIHFIVQGI